MRDKVMSKAQNMYIDNLSTRKCDTGLQYVTTHLQLKLHQNLGWRIGVDQGQEVQIKDNGRAWRRPCGEEAQGNNVDIIYQDLDIRDPLNGRQPIGFIFH